MRSICGLTAAVVAGTLAVVNAQSETTWKDPSSHDVRFVEVEPGVRLEVLQWGANGRPLVLLAGLGDTAHVFDDFAPLLSQSGFHVLAVTRRGFGASSAPATGYTFHRLAEDVVAVLDAHKIEKAILAGHSIAGEELNVLGTEHAQRMTALVYLDAAVDRTRRPSPEFQAATRSLPPLPAPGTQDLASYEAVRQYLLRTRSAVRPEAEVRATRLVDSDGRVGGPRPIDPQVQGAIMATLQKPEPPRWSSIALPALALYPVPHTVDDMVMPWYNDDPTTRSHVRTLYASARERVATASRDFRATLAGGAVVEIPGAHHHLFLTNPADVARELIRFAAAIQ